jgi:hypothetical protein
MDGRMETSGVCPALVIGLAIHDEQRWPLIIVEGVQEHLAHDQPPMCGLEAVMNLEVVFEA